MNRREREKDRERERERKRERERFKKVGYLAVYMKLFISKYLKVLDDFDFKCTLKLY